jgi:hypothetical protein
MVWDHTRNFKTQLFPSTVKGIKVERFNPFLTTSWLGFDNTELFSSTGNAWFVKTRSQPPPPLTFILLPLLGMKAKVKHHALKGRGIIKIGPRN